MILIAYDGSRDAQAAIDRAGELFPGQPALVLTVWEPFLDTVARTGTGLGLGSGALDFETIDRASERSGRDCAADGAERARRAGLAAEPHVRVRHTTLARAILAEAEAVGAAAVVLGSRGLGGLRSALMGSVSSGVLHHAELPVVIVPSPVAVQRRHAHRASTDHARAV